MNNTFCKEFENQVLSQLKNLTCTKEINSLRLGVAVSGGADSVSLLTALNSICKAAAMPLFVISVNHFIRPDEETCGDAAYVKELCNKYKTEGTDLSFSLVELEKGQVEKTAQKRDAGIEEAARYLRYQAFEKFILDNKLDFLCLAHNKNDQEETLLMRFLQGSGVESSAGIAAKRGKYIRPLIETERHDIEAYLTAQNIKWRTDSTNLDTQYLRNKIRLELMPFLTEKFPGWQGAVINGSKKAQTDGDFISSHVDKVFALVKDNSITISDFKAQHAAIQNRLIIRMCNNCGYSGRIPYAFVQDILGEINAGKCFKKCLVGKEMLKQVQHDESGNGLIEISSNGKELFVKNIGKTQTDLTFFDIIEESGKKDFPFGELAIEKCEKGIVLTCNEKSVLLEIDFPFCVRNIQSEDFIECKNGSLKKVIDIFSDWKISEEMRSFIPLIQELKSEKQELLCIFGEPLGFYNWVVRK